MTHTIHFNCKLCGKPGTTAASADCPPEQIDIFAKCICCHPCFTSREKFRKAESSIFSACHFMDNIDQFKNPDKIRSRAREVLTVSTRTYAEVVCSRNGLQTVWENSFVDMLLDRPDKVWTILKGYRDRVEDLAKPAQRELEAV